MSQPTGAMTRERFERATTFDEYVARMQVNQEKMIEFTNEVEVSPDDIDWWRSQGKLNLIVLTYDGCGDALYNLPVIAKIAKQAPNIDLRVVQREENLDLMDAHLNLGTYRSVPCFIFFDENFREIACLKERAASLSQIVEQEMIKVRRRLREENKVAWRKVMSDEFRNVVDTRTIYP